MELVVGGTLLSRIKEIKKFNEKDAAFCMINILQQLEIIHKSEIIHRDMKLENILMVSKDNNHEIKLADFGLGAQECNIELFKHCGTPGYVAPEVLKDEDYNCKADLFGAGVILFTLYAKLHCVYF